MISDADRDAILSSHLQVVAQITKPPEPKRWWESAGLVSALTAVLTVLVTSVLSYYVQKALRERENSFSEMQGRTQLARDAATQANSAMASMLKVNEERQLFSRGEMDYLNDSVKIALARNTNRLQQDWRVRREDAGMALYIAFDSTSRVSPAWDKTRDAIEAETTCVERAYVAHERNQVVPRCEKEIASRATAVVELRKRLKSGYDALRHLE